MIYLLLFFFILIPVLVLIFSFVFKNAFEVAGKVLLFHSLKPHLLDISSVSITKFQSIVQQLGKCGFQIGSLEDAQTNPNIAAITFDDAYEDLMQIRHYIQEQNIQITVFVPTAYIGKVNQWDNFLSQNKRRHLSSSQIKRLSDAGVQFGSHGHTHRDLTSLSENEIKKELMLSRKFLIEITGQEIKYLAFPFGKTNREVSAIAKACGYKHGYTTLPIASGGFERGRIAISRLDLSITIKAKLQPTILSGAEYIKAVIITSLSHLTTLTKTNK